MSLNPDKFTVLPGGLEAAVLHMSKQDLLHQTALTEVLASIIESEANAHGARFKATQFGKIIEAVKSSKISAYFLLAGWESCNRKIIGASIEFPTVVTKWEGDKFVHYPAMYGEDTSLLKNALKDLIRDCPENKFRVRNTGLAEFLEMEKIKRWTNNQYGDAPLGGIARARVGEYSAHSTAMIKVLDELGATRSTVENGVIVEINGLTDSMKDKWKVHTVTEEIKTAGSNEPYPNIFCTRWASPDGKQQICASFTNGISSFTGDPVTRVQITTNGNLPFDSMLQCVLASLLEAGEKEIQARRWGADSNPISNLVIPKVADTDNQQETYMALIKAAGEEVASKPFFVPKQTAFWGGKKPIMRIHASLEPKIITNLLDMEGDVRYLGANPMSDVIMDFENIPKDGLRFNLNPSQPVRIIRPRDAAEGLVLSLVG